MSGWFCRNDEQRGRMILLLIIGAVWWLLSPRPAFAARVITVTAVSKPADVVMQTASTSVSINVRNSNTGGNSGENIYRVQFRLLAGYTWILPTPPAGWSVSLNASRTRATFTTTSNTVPPKIATGQSQTFNLILGPIPQGSQDVANEFWLNRVTATYDPGSNPTARQNNPPGTSWNRRSLYMTLAASPSSVTASAPNNIITVTMTVADRRLSGSTGLTGVTSTPLPPSNSPVPSGFTVTAGANPTPVTLTPGQTKSLVWTYTVGFAPGKTCPQATPGTVTFSAQATAGNVSARSPSVTTNAVSIGCFTASIAAPACGVAGGSATVVMTVYNYNSSNMNSLRNATLTKDAASTATGTASCGAPAYSSFTAPPSSSSTTVTWSCTLPASALVGDTYIFDGQVTGTLQSDGNTYTTPLSSSAPLTFAATGIMAVLSLTNVPAGSTNVLITWTITNSGCTAQSLNNVQVTIPAAGAPPDAWTYISSASIVNNIDDWSDSLSGSVVTYAAGTPMPLGTSGDFDIMFSQVPTTQNPYVFNVHTTDTTGITRDISTTITVDPEAAGGVTTASPVQEVIQ